MKKLIMFLAILFTGLGIAQTDGIIRGGGYVWTDSLGYGVVATSDSVWIIHTNMLHDWYRFFVEGNANSPVDSFHVEAGAVRYSEGGTQQDTVWGSFIALKDSAWGDVNVVVNNSVGKDYLVFAPMAQLLRFTLDNHRATLVTRNVVITLNGKKIISR